MSTKHVLKRQADFFSTCGKCQTRYSCCFGTRPPISRRRSQVIREYLKEQGIMITDPFATQEYTYPRETAAGFCVFHDRKTRRCLVHAVKPETCVAGPITFDINTKKGKVEWFIKRGKICQLAEVVHRNKKLLQKHIKVAKQEVQRLLQDLDAEALTAILKKEEPETSKIGECDVDKHVLDGLNTLSGNAAPEGSS